MSLTIRRTREPVRVPAAIRRPIPPVIRAMAAKPATDLPPAVTPERAATATTKRAGVDHSKILTTTRRFRVVVERGEPPVKLSITHRCGAPEFGSNLNHGQAREAAPDDQAARRRVAGPNEIAASSSNPDEIEVKSAGFSPSAAGAADESIEQADFVVCESDRRRSVVLGSRQHGQPENPPTENADIEPCRPPFGLSRLPP